MENFYEHVESLCTGVTTKEESVAMFDPSFLRIVLGYPTILNKITDTLCYRNCGHSCYFIEKRYENVVIKYSISHREHYTHSILNLYFKIGDRYYLLEKSRTQTEFPLDDLYNIYIIENGFRRIYIFEEDNDLQNLIGANEPLHPAKLPNYVNDVISNFPIVVPNILPNFPSKINEAFQCAE